MAANSSGLKAREIAKLIREGRQAVNSYLYSHQSEYSVDSNYVWTMKRITEIPTQPVVTASPSSGSNVFNSSRCCYVNNIGVFVAETEQAWLDSVQNNFTRILSLPLGESRVRAWKECFRVLKNQLPAIFFLPSRCGDNRENLKGV